MQSLLSQHSFTRPSLTLNPDFTPSFDLKAADPNNLIGGYTPPTGGTFNGMPLEGGGLGEISGIAFNPPKQEAPPLAEVYTNPVTKQLLDDFGKSDFAKNVNHMQQDHMEIDLNGLPISGNGSFIGSLMEYLKSVGKDNMVSNKNLQKFEHLAQVPSTPNPIQGIGLDGKPNEPPMQQPTVGIGSLQPYQNQFKDFEKRLENIEQGVGSLLNKNQMYMSNNMGVQGYSSTGYSPDSVIGNLLKWSYR